MARLSAHTRNHQIAILINQLECAHIDRAGHKIGTAAWHRSNAAMYTATADLFDLGIPMALITPRDASGAAALRVDAARNLEAADMLEAAMIAEFKRETAMRIA